VLDRIICAKGKDSFSESYTAEQAVVSSKLINETAPELMVIFRPWHGGGRVVGSLIKHLSTRAAVLDYEFHDQIIEPNIERVPESFQTIGEKVSEDLDRLVAEYDYHAIHLVGMSLGSVALALAAKNYPDFSSSTLVVAGDNLATLMWEGARTRAIQQAFIEQGITKLTLDKAWQSIAPKNQAGAFKGKKVKMVISKKDRLLPTAGQFNLRDSLRMAGADVSCIYSSLGHSATISRFCLSKGKI
jgi:pimeloyl-ACP methyl ester carboxylesterase